MVLDVTVTCPDHATAREITDALLGADLAACCQFGAPVESRYRWRGAIETAHEIPLLIKTRGDLFDTVADRIRTLHPYETPAITAQAVRADEATAKWIEEATKA